LVRQLEVLMAGLLGKKMEVHLGVKLEVRLEELMGYWLVLL